MSSGATDEISGSERGGLGRTLSTPTDLESYKPEATIRTLQFTNGDVYEGETLADLRHGRGRHSCANGDLHDGFWYKGMRHGQGEATFVRGFSYKGGFEYDHAHGPGRAKYENGAVYEGDFERDQRSGWGVQCFPDESMYIGEWSNDNISGKGRLTMKDGSYFEGQWEGENKAKGNWVSADRQETYTGDWTLKGRHGNGVLNVQGLMQYTGEWQDDKPDGKGRCRWVDGSVYDGHWKQGCRSGAGIFTSADGYKYDGDWLDDREHGRGKARLSSGERYTGDFTLGQFNGNGRSLSADGERYEGTFVAGKRQGHGACVYANGEKYTGEWANGRRHGEGSCRFADGTVFHGQWHCDQWTQSEADPSLSKVSGLGLARSVAGQKAEFKISARDENRNKRLAGGDKFVAWLEGPATLHADLTDHNDGSYTASYTATRAGIYDLYITNDTGEPVAEAPFPLRVLPGTPDPRRSIVKLMDSAKAAVVGQAAGFKIEARDCHNNRCKLAKLPDEMPVDILLTCGNITCEVILGTAREGQLSCSFTPKEPGLYRLSIMSNGKMLCNSPNAVKVDLLSDGDSNVSSDQALTDHVAEWERKAAQQYGEDGDAAGWSSDTSQHETAEQIYIREHPDVPVVERLEDMWLVSKLQQERKDKQERRQALRELQELKAAEQAQSETHSVTNG